MNRLIVIFVILSISILASDSMIVFNMSSSQIDADKEVQKIDQKLSKSNYLGIRPPPKVESIKVGNRWIVASSCCDINSTNRVKMFLYKEYPFALIINNHQSKGSKEIIFTQSRANDYLTIKWSILILIGVLGLVGVVLVLIRASKIKQAQDDLERQQKDLMNRILKSEEYV